MFEEVSSIIEDKWNFLKEQNLSSQVVLRNVILLKSEVSMFSHPQSSVNDSMMVVVAGKVPSGDGHTVVRVFVAANVGSVNMTKPVTIGEALLTGQVMRMARLEVELDLMLLMKSEVRVGGHLSHGGRHIESDGLVLSGGKQ